MGPAEELVRIAKKLDKMVAGKSTVRWPSSPGRVCVYLHTCVFIYTRVYLHTCLFTHVRVYKHLFVCCCCVAWERGGLLFSPLMLSLQGLSGFKGCCLCHPSPASGLSSQCPGGLILALIWGSPVPHCSQTQGFGGEGGCPMGGSSGHGSAVLDCGQQVFGPQPVHQHPISARARLTYKQGKALGWQI